MQKVIIKLGRIFIPCKINHYRPIFLESRFLFCYAIALLILKLITVPYLIYLPKTVFFADITKTALISLTNTEREKLGLPPLNENQTLNEAASLKAGDIIAKDYFSHQSPEGTSPWHWFQVAGYNYRSAGENLAIGFLDSEEVYQAWLNSPTHQKNLLNPAYEEIGIAVVEGDFQGNDTTIVVQLFGTPKTVIATSKEPEVSPETPQKEILPEEISEEEVSPNPIEENPIEETPTEEKMVLPSETSPQQKEFLSASAEEEPRENLSLNFLSFIIANYADILQKIIYGSLIFVLASLFITVFFDLFIYKALQIQYKDIVLKAVGFSLLLVALILFDKETIVTTIPHVLQIY